MKKEKAVKGNEISLLTGSLIPSLALLRRNDPLQMAGATAFFTTFALPPIVFILARIFGLLLSPRTVGRGLIENLSNNLGDAGAEQVREVIKSIRGFNSNWYMIVFGFLFLLFVATTLFTVIKNSFDRIWAVSMEKETNIKLGLLTRLRSLAVIALVGLLFFADLVFKSIETMGGNYLEKNFGGAIYFKIIFSEVTGIFIVSVWFTILFRFLADAKPKWKAAITGGLFTGLLFTAGRVVLRALLVKGNIGELYGSSASLVLVLLFVFYTSFIMYYGACFIAVYSGKKKWPMQEQQAP